MPVNGVTCMNVVCRATLQCYKCVRLLLNLVKFSCGKSSNLGVGTGGCSNEEGLQPNSIQRKPATQGHGELRRCAADWLGLQEAAGCEETGRLPTEAPGGSREFLTASEELLQTNPGFLETPAVSMEAFPRQQILLWTFWSANWLVASFELSAWLFFFFVKCPKDNTANYSFLNVEFIMNIDKELISY